MKKIGHARRQMRREKLFTFILLFLALLPVLAIASCTGEALYTSWFGPFEKTGDDLLTLSQIPEDDLSDEPGIWVSISADAVYPLATSYTDYHLDGDLNYTVHATVIQLDEHLVLVELDDPPDIYETNTFNGLISHISNDPCCYHYEFHQEILQEFNERYPDIDDEFLSIILERPSRSISNYRGYSVFILIWVLLCSFGVWRAYRRARDPRRHHVMRGLRHYGDPLEVVGEIEHEMEHDLIEAEKKYIVTKHWFVFAPWDKFQAIPYTDIMWMYKVQTTFGSKFYIYSRYGQVISLHRPPEWLTEMLKQDEAPWAENEYSTQKYIQWFFKRKAFIKRVDMIRSEYEKPKKRKQ